MKHLIILTSLCVALCADTNIDSLTPFTALFQEDGTNICKMELRTNIVTQWLPIEREESPRGATVKQIGILVTNQVLTVIAYEKTNEVVLKVLGREEWPSQRRTVIVPNQQRKP